MSYVFFDLEWNQGYSKNETDKIDEIIQIGAYKFDDWQREGESFSSYIRPVIHKKLHHRVRKILPLDVDGLKKAPPFRSAMKKFFDWCGESPMFFTWGNCDARVLDINLCWYGVEEYLDIEVYDLQYAYDMLVTHTSQQASLRLAVEHFGLDQALEYHDAGNDAFYTALVGREMFRQFKTLPTENELFEMEEKLKQKRKEEAYTVAIKALDELLNTSKPILEKRTGVFTSDELCLRGRGIKNMRCPCVDCHSILNNNIWFKIDEYYISKSGCTQHGKFYSIMDSSYRRKKLFYGKLSIYNETSALKEAFKLCKSGGDKIVIEMPSNKQKSKYKK